MYQTVKIFTATLLFLGSACTRAEQAQPDHFHSDKKQWKPIDSQTLPNRYDKVTRDNQWLSGKSAQRFLENGFTSFSVPEQGIEFTDAIIRFAIDGGPLHLNESKTMALELDEMTNEDRALSFKLKLRW